ncbi:MAG: MOSC domain-containing protein [Planctomycetales bacterium]|nr:MOSC domain-containing protein [Planctomycetales bacterium]
MRTIAELKATLPQIGRVEWIGISPAARADIVTVAAVEVLAGHGIVGDHHAKGRVESERQVTLIQSEHLATVASLVGRDAVPPALVRRNVAVSGINLLALKGQQFRLGDALLEHTGPCEPCSRMEEILGPGGYNAMRGHGGITARVLRTGPVRIGDEVAWIGTTEDTDYTEG